MKAQLNIHAAFRDGRTVLKDAYFTPPFKLMNVTEDRSAGDLHLMLMSASPGILDGDEYQVRIQLDEFTRLKLHTQAYQRLFHMQGEATQRLDVQLAPNASFYFLPHPTVPHTGSSFVNQTDIHLSRNNQLVFGEVLTCGRKLNGEQFNFTRYQNLTRIFIGERLVMKENLWMEPGADDLTGIGQLEGYSHQASLFLLQHNADLKTCREALQEMLNDEREITAGITAAPVDGLLVRLLGHGAEQLHQLLKALAETFITHQTIEHAC